MIYLRVGLFAEGPTDSKYYADLGKETKLAELRKLAAFQRFETELRAAIVMVAGLGGPTVAPR